MTCKDCIGYKYCNPQPIRPRSVEKWCKKFKNKADFVEVVRCKNCKEYKDTGVCTAFQGLSCVENPETDFCSYGERIT